MLTYIQGLLLANFLVVVLTELLYVEILHIITVMLITGCCQFPECMYVVNWLYLAV